MWARGRLDARWRSVWKAWNLFQGVRIRTAWFTPDQVAVSGWTVQESLTLLSGLPLAIVEEAGRVQFVGILNGLGEQLHHLCEE